jgi:alcohol dehydrogenase (cytochrome c)
MALKQWLLAGLLVPTCLVTIAAAGPIENYSPVTADRLKNPEPGNWMHYRRTYDGQGYSPLDQINLEREKPDAGLDVLDRCGRGTRGPTHHQ